MKTFIAGILFLLGFNAHAQHQLQLLDQQIGKIVSEKTVTLSVDISKAKLKFTNLGYGNIFFVKVIVPDLASETVLNHRNVGEDGPCLFTHDTRNVNDVIQDNPDVLETDFKITLRKEVLLTQNSNVCKVTLIEDVRANIRGFHFQHTLRHPLPDRVADDCL